MIHIVQHPKSKKYEVVCLSKNGQYIVGSKQGYEKKAGCYTAIKALIKSCFVSIGGAIVLYQDDTTIIPGVWSISTNERKFQEGIKPKRRYATN